MSVPHFREAKCGLNPLKCQFDGLEPLMPRLRARSARVLQGFLYLRLVFFGKKLQFRRPQNGLALRFPQEDRQEGGFLHL